MIFAYGANALAGRRKGLLMALGLVTIPLSFQFQGHASQPRANTAASTSRKDPRVARLHKFLRQLRCPVAPMSEDFIRAADANHLDWRLLPSIAVIESGGGKAYKNNNIFGWDGGEQSFATIRSGLELVASRLGGSPLYRRHNSAGKLRIYNQHEDYAPAVLSVMNRICPDASLRRIAVRPAVNINTADAQLIRD